MDRELRRMKQDVIHIEIEPDSQSEIQNRDSLSKQPLNEKELTAHEQSQEDKRSIQRRISQEGIYVGPDTNRIKVNDISL